MDFFKLGKTDSYELLYNFLHDNFEGVTGSASLEQIKH